MVDCGLVRPDGITWHNRGYPAVDPGFPICFTVQAVRLLVARNVALIRIRVQFVTVHADDSH